MNSKGISRANHTTGVENSADHLTQRSLYFAQPRAPTQKTHCGLVVQNFFFNEELQYFEHITVQKEKISEKHKGEALSAELKSIINYAIIN